PRRLAIGGDLGKQDCRILPPSPGCVDTLSEPLEALAVGTVPAFDGRCCPCRRLIEMAVIAGVGRAIFDGQVRARDTETMVMAPIDNHIGPAGHMARAA